MPRVVPVSHGEDAGQLLFATPPPLLRGKGARNRPRHFSFVPRQRIRPRCSPLRQAQGPGRAAFPAATAPCGAVSVVVIEKRGHHHPKTVVVVPVVRVVPVAVGDARVAMIVVERATTHHAEVFGSIATSHGAGRLATHADRCLIRYCSLTLCASHPAAGQSPPSSLLRADTGRW